MTDLGVICPPSLFGRAYPDRKHKLTRPDCPDASYQIWFESARYFGRRRRFCGMLTDGRKYVRPYVRRDGRTLDPLFEVISEIT